MIFLFQFKYSISCQECQSRCSHLAITSCIVMAFSVFKLSLFWNLFSQFQYKKNLWMTVSAMCASLSTSAIIVLFYNTYWPNMNRLTKTVCMVDTVAFLSLPFLLGARMMIALNLTTYIQPSLRAASRLVPTNELMDELKCSIVPMESLPLCSVIVERSIFPVVVLKFLIVLCVLTAAYILLAYLIEYCIRHWFPPSDQDKVAKRVLVETA
uniref:G_PROTEIN_RECEP_F1_2 domain-containing protein n=1 Tax=Angiostrongylus cantonensis TaxID=6313 RepID=A0A0K0DNJ2_ANGCA